MQFSRQAGRITPVWSGPHRNGNTLLLELSRLICLSHMEETIARNEPQTLRTQTPSQHMLGLYSSTSQRFHKSPLDHQAIAVQVCHSATSRPKSGPDSHTTVQDFQNSPHFLVHFDVFRIFSISIVTSFSALFTAQSFLRMHATLRPWWILSLSNVCACFILYVRNREWVYVYVYIYIYVLERRKFEFICRRLITPRSLKMK